MKKDKKKEKNNEILKTIRRRGGIFYTKKILHQYFVFLHQFYFTP